MGLGLAFRCFFGALSGHDTRDRLRRAIDGVVESPQIKEIIKEVQVPKEVKVEVEVIKEVIREVPKEVIKLIPDTHGPALLLSLLQQDGRLIDFLNEEIAGYEDDQIGAAVREIHANCRKAMNKYVTLVPVRQEKEGETVNLDAGYDASAVRVTGKVSGQGSVRGTLRHRGWRAAKIELPPRPSGADPAIIMPAEIEVE